MASQKSAWELREAVGRPPAVVCVKNLQTTVQGPDDAWGRRDRPQPMLVSARAVLRRGFGATSARDALDADTVHYGQLSKAILASLEALPAARNTGSGSARGDEPLDLFRVLSHIWLRLTGCDPLSGYRLAAGTGAGKPLVNAAAVRSLEITAKLPKASLVGQGACLTLSGVLDGDSDCPVNMCARTLRLHGLRVPTVVGINDNERKAKQAVVVNVEVDNFRAPCDTFQALEARIVECIEASSFGTLEALSARLAEVITCYTREEGHEPNNGSGCHLTVAVEKPIAVPFADAPSVELRVNTKDALGR
ncbi:hypothetical protein HIM_02347 [Hirsutella minnesotensis 3608]|nr:hypothetical protein HIM_02347 [Hirsutella minnesotensis 3608]